MGDICGPQSLQDARFPSDRGFSLRSSIFRRTPEHKFAISRTHAKQPVLGSPGDGSNARDRTERDPFAFDPPPQTIQSCAIHPDRFPEFG